MRITLIWKHLDRARSATRAVEELRHDGESDAPLPGPWVGIWQLGCEDWPHPGRRFAGALADALDHPFPRGSLRADVGQEVLAVDRAATDWDGRAVGLGDELYAREAVVAEGPPTENAPAPLKSQSTEA